MGKTKAYTKENCKKGHIRERKEKPKAIIVLKREYVGDSDPLKVFEGIIRDALEKLGRDISEKEKISCEKSDKKNEIVKIEKAA